MLDTRTTPLSRPRRSPSSARPELRSTARSTAAPRPDRSRTVREEAAAEPIRRSLPSARTSRLAKSEMRLMGLATACTAIVCALLLLYLTAYARVTQLGIAQAQARTQLHQAQLRNELLQAERNTLESPQRLAAAAAALGMTPRGATPVDYIAARPALEGMKPKEQPSVMASGWEQGSDGGTTENSSAAAFGGH